MDNVSDILDQRCVILELNARKKEDAIKELVGLFASAGKIKRADDCVTAILEREKISTTGIGHGVAIPHRLVAGASEIMMAVGRKNKGVPFDSIDGKPAHLIFLILGPSGKHNDYLKILSKLSRLLSDRTFFETLMKVKNAVEVIELIREKEAQYQPYV